MVDRRAFLRLGAASVGAPLMGGLARAAEASSSSLAIRRRVRLGGTGLEVSDISFGSSRISDPDLVRHAFERGINYFDTAESYQGGDAEEAIGKALHGVREQVLIASKTKARSDDTRANMMKALEGSLRRLRTDHVDVYFNHAVNEVERMRNEEWWAFTEEAKASGKIRFRGMSGHGSHLIEALDYAIDHDLVDVILVAFSFAQDPDFYARMKHTLHFVALQEDLPRVLRKARERSIGVVAMKTLLGARLNDMRPYERGGGTFAQAAFRWALSQPFLDALVITMTSRALIDEYVGASGDPALSSHDLHLLELYAHLQAGRYCWHGCGVCEASCPHQVEIAEVLRARMYDVDYRDHAVAVTEYAGIERDASACLACAEQACLRACPIGLPVATFTRDAAARLA